MIKDKKELISLLDYLKKTKEKERRYLGEEPAEGCKDFLIAKSPRRIKSWNLLGRFFDQDFKKLAKVYL